VESHVVVHAGSVSDEDQEFGNEFLGTRKVENGCRREVVTWSCLEGGRESSVERNSFTIAREIRLSL
jgi:hypothetical protein